MKYFKLKKEGKIIGVINSNDFRALQVRHNSLMVSDEMKGQFIEYGNKLYRDTWMIPTSNDLIPYEIAEIVETTKELYDEYFEAIQEGEAIPEPIIHNPPVIEIEETKIENTDIVAAKQIKLAALSNACHQAIENGFNFEEQHYSLTAYDQLNIVTLSSLIANGRTEVPYHADGEEVKYYDAEEFRFIAEMAAHHISYHTAYYNALKAYVNSLETEEEVLAVQYGDEIPEEYQTAVLKNL